MFGVWWEVGVAAAWHPRGERVGDEIRQLSWIGKRADGPATSVGHALCLWPCQGAGWRSGHRRSADGVLPSPGHA